MATTSVIASLVGEEAGRYTYSFTGRDYLGVYETNKTALDHVMRSLEVGEP